MDTVTVSIIVAIITGIFSLIGSLVAGKQANDKVMNALKISQAVTDTKLENLTGEVRQHNNFATKVPQLETRVGNLEQRVTRLEDK